MRLIDPDGAQLGVKPLPEAISIARSMDLDLVEVAPDANPPVCRIMDFNRYKYEASQRARESRRKTTSTSIKEMKYRPKIGTGDFDTKTRQVAKFLGEGHKVKITIMFRGREMSHPELGKKILDHVAETVGPVAKVEAEPKLDGRNMTMVLAPDRRAVHATRGDARRPEGTPGQRRPATDGAPEQAADGHPDPAVTTVPEQAADGHTDPAVTTAPAAAAPALGGGASGSGVAPGRGEPGAAAVPDPQTQP